MYKEMSINVPYITRQQRGLATSDLHYTDLRIDIGKAGRLAPSLLQCTNILKFFIKNNEENTQQEHVYS